jgi:nicotinamide mononucleotide transporter
MKEWMKKNFWTGYSAFEKAFLWGMVALQIAVFMAAPDTPLNIVAGIACVISVVLCAKGKVLFYFIGFVQTVTYLVLAWQNRFYGEVLENIFYFVTMIWCIFVWKANTKTNEDGTEDVNAKKFTAGQWLASCTATAAATLAMGWWLNSIGSAQAYTDAATNVLAIFAQILMVRRYREQWLWWLAIDLLCIKMWWAAGNWSMVAMYAGWTANCIYGWVNWTKLERKKAR